MSRRYQAYVYTRKQLSTGMVRLYLRTPDGKRCGYQDVTPAKSEATPGGKVLRWEKVDFQWKHRKTKHGTPSGYKKGCRCNSCKKAYRVYRRQKSTREMIEAMPILFPELYP